MRKYLFIIGILIASTCFAQVGLQKISITDFSGGQNSFDLNTSIAQNQGESMINVVISKKGKISKRQGQALFWDDLGSDAFTGLGRFDPDSATSYIMAASGTDIIRATTAASTWTVVNAGNALSDGYDTEFVQANNQLFVFNGQDDTSWYDGGTWTAGSGWENNAGSPPTATTATWLNNYMFAAGHPSYSDWVFYSTNLYPTSFPTSNVFRVNTGDGQAIERLEAFKLFELIVYKERSIFVLDLEGTTSAWTLQPITTSIGCIAPRSVVSLGNDHWFLSSDPIAVRSLVRTSFDKLLIEMVSQPIQDYFDGSGDTTINTTYIDKACAVLYDNKYILAVPTGTSMVNNTVFVYDFLAKAWYVIENWYPAAWLVYNDELHYIDANDGRVIECFSGTTGDWAEGPNTIDRASSPTVGINFEYVTPAIDFGNAENYKGLDSIEIEYVPTGNYTADVYVNLDDDGWTDVGDLVLSGNAVILPAYLPFTLTSAGIGRQMLQLQQYGEFKTIQVKVAQDSTSESITLRRITIFARPKPWRRE